MDPRLIFGISAAVLFLAYFFFFRSMKSPPSQVGRPDRLEPPELTGTAQYENRKNEQQKDAPKNV